MKKSVIIMALAMLGALVSLAAPARALAFVWPQLTLKPVAAGLARPTLITHAGDSSGRIFVLEKGGLVKIIKNGALLPTPFLDLSSRITTDLTRDGGLLGLAFPPGFAEKKHFYVYYTETAGSPVLSRFQVDAVNPDLAVLASEEVLLTFIPQTPNLHQGGTIAFHPLTGYLYVCIGDASPQGDPANNAQNPGLFHGKILRLDVEGAPDSGKAYRVPPDNPFVGDPAYLPEIWALGLRNPYRCSFSPEGAFYIADVGWNSYEELNVEPPDSVGGRNYGWNILEGPEFTGLNGDTPPAHYAPPTVSFPLPLFSAIIGGYVFRGAGSGRLKGLYVFGNFGRMIWGLRPGSWQAAPLLATSFLIGSCGEDEAANLYVIDYFGGAIHQIRETIAPIGALQMLLLD